MLNVDQHNVNAKKQSIPMTVEVLDLCLLDITLNFSKLTGVNFRFPNQF